MDSKELDELALKSAGSIKDRWPTIFRDGIEFETAEEDIAPLIKPMLLEALYAVPEHHKVLVHATCLVEDPEDEVAGAWGVEIQLGNKFEDFASIALDVFHNSVAVGDLEEYEFHVTCEGVRLEEKDDAESYVLKSEGRLIGYEGSN